MRRDAWTAPPRERRLAARAHELPRAADVGDRREAAPYVNEPREREDREEREPHEQVRLEEPRRIGDVARRVAAERDDVLRPRHQLHHQVAVGVARRFEDRRQPEHQRDEQPREQHLVAAARDGCEARVRQAPVQQDREARERERAHHAARGHRDELLELVRDAERVPDGHRREQTDQMPEEQAEHADVKKDVARAQRAAVQQLRAVGLPCVLLALEAREAAEQEDGGGDVRIDAVDERIQIIHDVTSKRVRDAPASRAGSGRRRAARRVKADRLRERRVGRGREQRFDAVGAGAEALERLVHRARRRLGDGPRLDRRARAQHVEGARVRALRAREALAERGEHVDRVAEQVRRVRAVAVAVAVARDRAEELDEERHVVGQLVADGLEAVAPVFVEQIDHRLAAVAALAVHVLEQMQRMRRRAVERRDVAFLQLDQRRRAQRFDERRERRARAGLRVERAFDLGQRVEQRLLGIGEQGGQNRIDRHDVFLVRCAHAALAFLRVTVGSAAYDTAVSFLRPNSVPSDVPPEQPLPNEKPQLPFSSKLSSAISLCDDGITKRSS
ncbi:hypothetical protein BURPS1710b_2760 [Burkholderia pseudomallei 1710b]|uniref:Uncharacterized protein n=1 Tax=Burkholderia pseudomallei (strain 1710b) TaxID=320372 RepID=Q3JQK9_BURP1|nr:hypothetical protein BURPS1710b_2760 [Burkholderia pseudomallei 1710b]